jgi:hypothetical protein
MQRYVSSMQPFPLPFLILSALQPDQPAIFFSSQKSCLTPSQADLTLSDFCFSYSISRFGMNIAIKITRGIYIVGNAVAAHPGENKALLADANEKGGTKAADYHPGSFLSKLSSWLSKIVSLFCFITSKLIPA